MGHEKDRQIQESKDQATADECSYCERSSTKGPIAISFDDLMEVIGGAIFQYYDHCENEAIAWDNEDQQYIGTTYQTHELVHWEIPTPSDRQDVMEDIVDSLGDNEWCDKSPYSLTGAERTFSSWEDFCTTVKHETRYFFESKKKDEEWSEKIPVPEMLHELRDIINYAGLIGVIPAGTHFYRIRPHGRTEVCNSWDTLGSLLKQREQD